MPALSIAPVWYIIGIGVCLLICGVVVVLVLRQNAAQSKNYALAKLKLHKLPASNPTRQRIAEAQKVFAQGWQVGLRLATMCAG